MDHKSAAYSRHTLLLLKRILYFTTWFGDRTYHFLFLFLSFMICCFIVQVKFIKSTIMWIKKALLPFWLSRGQHDVAPKVNLRNSLFADNKACISKRSIHPGFENRGQMSPQVQNNGTLQKGLMSSNFFKEIKIKKLNIAFLLNTLDEIGPSICPKHCLGQGAEWYDGKINPKIPISWNLFIQGIIS